MKYPTLALANALHVVQELKQITNKTCVPTVPQDPLHLTLDCASSVPLDHILVAQVPLPARSVPLADSLARPLEQLDAAHALEVRFLLMEWLVSPARREQSLRPLGQRSASNVAVDTKRTVRRQTVRPAALAFSLRRTGSVKHAPIIRSATLVHAHVLTAPLVRKPTTRTHSAFLVALERIPLAQKPVSPAYPDPLPLVQVPFAVILAP